jgi:4'-phosphopantetheinyl transferase
MEKISQKPYAIISIDGASLLVLDNNESMNELIQELDNVDFSEFSKLVSDKRKLEYLGVRVALKQLLGCEKTIIYDTDRKPSLSDNSFNISVSHSGKWIALMAHPTRLVGIDIEVPTEKIKKIYNRFLSETEQNQLSNGENMNQLMLAWSAKEALYKIIGKDAVDFANQLHIFPFELKDEGKLSAEHIASKQKYQLQYIQNKFFTLVYCIV